MNERAPDFSGSNGMCLHGNFSNSCETCQKERVLSEEESVRDVVEVTERILKQMDAVMIRPEDRNVSGELLVSPDGPVSNLPEREWKMVRTKSFKEWFGESLVLDAHDEPMIVYHGSNEHFSRFDASQSTKPQVDSGYFGQGNYFTEHQPLAEKYGSLLYRTFLKIEKLQVFSVDHGNVRFRDKQFPEEIHDEIFSRYEKRRQETLGEIKKKREEARKKEGALAGWGWVDMTSEDEDFEQLLSEEVTHVLKERGFGGVLGYNPVSKVYEYAVFNGNDVMIIPEE